MGQEYCRICDQLKEFYRLKVNHFLLAARSTARWTDQEAAQQELHILKEESLEALRALIRHEKACYGLAVDEAA